MSCTLLSVPTIRRGRDYYRSTGDRGGLAGVFSLLLGIVFLCIPPALVCLSVFEHSDVVSPFARSKKNIPFMNFLTNSNHPSRPRDVLKTDIHLVVLPIKHGSNEIVS